MDWWSATRRSATALTRVGLHLDDGAVSLCSSRGSNYREGFPLRLLSKPEILVEFHVGRWDPLVLLQDLENLLVFSSIPISRWEVFGCPFCSPFRKRLRLISLPLLRKLIRVIVAGIKRAAVVVAKHLFIELNNLFVLSFSFGVILLVS